MMPTLPALSVQGPNIGNAFARGKVLGGQINEVRAAQADRQRQAQARNALGALLSGDQEAFGQLAQADPELALNAQNTLAQMQQQQQAQAAKQGAQSVVRIRGLLANGDVETAAQEIQSLPDSPEKQAALQSLQQGDVDSVVGLADTLIDSYTRAGLLEPPDRIKVSRGQKVTDPRGTTIVEGNPPKRTERDKEIQNLIERGVPENWARDVASGNVTTESDQFGNVIAINRATGEVRTLRGAGQDQGEVTVGTPRQPGEGDVFSAVEQGTGPFAVAQSAISNVIGPFREGAMFPETSRARTHIRLFNQQAKTALVNNPRFPVAEQELIHDMLPDPDTVFTDPDAQREELNKLHSFLTNKIQQNQRSIESGRVTQKERGELSNENEAIRRVLNMMGSPGGDIGSMSLEQLQSLDSSNMSDEELQRAAERWEELNAQ